MKLRLNFGRVPALCIGLADRLPSVVPDIRCLGRMGRETRPRLGRVGRRSI